MPRLTPEAHGAPSRQRPLCEAEEDQGEKGEAFMKAARYARVSTSDQHNGIKCARQPSTSHAVGWELAGTTDQMSVAKMSRPVLEQLVGDAGLRRLMPCAGAASDARAL
jgi:predicted site-specific integrase-resolvase